MEKDHSNSDSIRQDYEADLRGERSRRHHRILHCFFDSARRRYGGNRVVCVPDPGAARFVALTDPLDADGYQEGRFQSG